MAKLDFGKSLKRFGEDTVAKIEGKIIQNKTIDTGYLLRNIEYFQKGTFIEFSMVDYGKFTDDGTKYIEPREFFNKVIEDAADDLEDYLYDDIVLEIERKLNKKR